MAYLGFNAGHAQDLIRARKLRDKSIDIAKVLSDNSDKANSAKNIIINLYNEYIGLYENSYKLALKDLEGHINFEQGKDLLKTFENGFGPDTPGLINPPEQTEELTERERKGYKLDSIKNHKSIELYLESRTTEDIFLDYLFHTMLIESYGETLQHKISTILEAISPENASKVMDATGFVYYAFTE